MWVPGVEFGSNYLVLYLLGYLSGPRCRVVFLFDLFVLYMCYMCASTHGGQGDRSPCEPPVTWMLGHKLGYSGRATALLIAELSLQSQSRL